MATLPTTAKAEAQFQVVEPHGEIHEESGTDPVLPNTRIIALKELPNDSTNSVSFVDFYETDVITRGGILVIQVSGDFTASARLDSVASETISIGVRVVVNGTALGTQFNSITQAPAGTALLSINNSGTLSFLYAPLNISGQPSVTGKVTITIQYVSNNTSSYVSIGHAFLTVFEYFPVRRG